MDIIPLTAADRLRLISQLCDGLADDLRRGAEPPLPPPPCACGAHERPETIAARLLRMRRKRDALFGADLFADPAWDILLDLLIAEAAGKPVSISSACIAAAVPSTTALRWITVLVEHGLAVREPHPTDRRIVHVRLRPETRSRLEALLVSL